MAILQSYRGLALGTSPESSDVSQTERQAAKMTLAEGETADIKVDRRAD